MNRAIMRARDNVNIFIEALHTPKNNRDSFLVKMRFVDGKSAEHMWLTNVTYDGHLFAGKLEDTPIAVRNVKQGQYCTVAPTDISDWIFYEHNKMVGGYTVAVIRDREKLGREQNIK